jgi:tetratricopeptide (TPR) repeat protein
MRRTLLLAALVALAGCVPKKVHEEPIMENDQRVGDSSEAVAQAAARAADAKAKAQERDALTAQAMASCVPEVCDAIVRGELAIGMNEIQVLAATGTTDDAWSIRHAGEATVMMPNTSVSLPSDVVGDIAMVQLTSNSVNRYAYREPQGVRVVDSPADATTEGRATAMAEALVREGDDYAARGDFEAALNRYDRASILTPGDPMVDFKTASALDKALRPYAALIQYQLFLHRLEIERIEARGEAAAQLAEAIALAQQRILILERQVPSQ